MRSGGPRCDRRSSSRALTQCQFSGGTIESFWHLADPIGAPIKRATNEEMALSLRNITSRSPASGYSISIVAVSSPGRESFAANSDNQVIIIIIPQEAVRSRIGPAVGFETNAVQGAYIRLAS
jgi:hypothetical protein